MATVHFCSIKPVHVINFISDFTLSSAGEQSACPQWKNFKETDASLFRDADI